MKITTDLSPNSCVIDLEIKEQLDHVHPRKPIKCKLEDRNGALLIMPEGYGDSGTATGHGCPIVLEMADGRLRLLVWKDILTDQDPTIIDLEDAREDRRKDEPDDTD